MKLAVVHGAAKLPAVITCAMAALADSGSRLPWLSIGSGLHLMAFCMVVAHCLTHRREPTSTVLWFFIAWFIPLVGPLLFLIFGVNRVPAKGWKKEQASRAFLSHRRAREEEAMPLSYWRSLQQSSRAEPSDPVSLELNRMMDKVLLESPLLSGNSIEPLVTGEAAFPPMLDAIERAQHHIHLQTYILGNDETGRLFLDRLEQKARSGVKVRLLCDSFGSSTALLRGLAWRYRSVPNMQIAAWAQVNPLKRLFQINLRNHRKLLVVDGIEAFTGGINLHSLHLDKPGQAAIRDYHFRVRGPVVHELQYLFLSDWHFMTTEDPELLLSERHFPPIAPAGKALVRVISAGPTSEVEALTDILCAAIAAARHQVLAVTPYFVPTLDILRAFRVAALRGLDVRLVVPRVSNHRYVALASRALYDDLLSAGVRIFERHPPFLHAKALIIDGELSIVGSANLDVRSLRLNYETNLAVFDESFTGELKRVVHEDIGRSRELNLNLWRARSLTQRMLENFCNLLTPAL